MCLHSVHEECNFDCNLFDCNTDIWTECELGRSTSERQKCQLIFRLDDMVKLWGYQVPEYRVQ